MNKTSNLFLIAIALIAFTVMPVKAAQYDYYSYTTVLDGGTNNVLLKATNTLSTVITLPYSEYVPLFVQARTITTNTVALNLQLSRSVDGVTFDTIDPIIVTITGATNAGNSGYSSLATNVFVGGIRAVKIFAIGNVNGTGSATNVTVQYGIKR